MSTEAVFQHPVAISQVMVNFAARYGVDAATCLLGTGITEDQLRDADGLIGRDQEMRLVENLILALPQVPTPGFELGLQYNVSTFGIFGFVMRISRNLREAIHSALRYMPLSTAYCKFSLLSNQQDFGVSLDPSSIPQHLRQFLLERDMATAMNLFHELGLHGVRVHRLEFQTKVPSHSGRIRELCGIEPQYGCGNNAVILKREDAEARMTMFDAHLVRLLEEQCRIQLELRQISGVTGQVRQHLLSPLGFVSSLEHVAEKMAMAPRSLRRRLDEEGNSFRDLVESERKQIAIQLLESTEMKLDEMALQLGYGDTASFTRAFRRWFGRPPSEYRKLLRNG